MPTPQRGRRLVERCHRPKQYSLFLLTGTFREPQLPPCSVHGPFTISVAFRANSTKLNIRRQVNPHWLNASNRCSHPSLWGSIKNGVWTTVHGRCFVTSFLTPSCPWCSSASMRLKLRLFI